MIRIHVVAPVGADVPKDAEVQPTIGQVVYAVLRIDERMRLQGYRMKHVQENTHPGSRVQYTVTLTFARE